MGMNMIKRLTLKRRPKWTTSIRRYSASLVIREMQVKTISRQTGKFFFKSKVNKFGEAAKETGTLIHY